MSQGKTSRCYINVPFTAVGGPSLSLITGGVIGLNTFTSAATWAITRVWYQWTLPCKSFLSRPRVSAARHQQLDAIDDVHLALRSVDLGVPHSAMRMAGHAVQHAEQAADTHALLGTLRGLRRRTRHARQTGWQTLQRALTHDPNHRPTLLFLAEKNRELGELVEALQYADRAVAADPEDWQGYQDGPGRTSTPDATTKPW